MTDSGGDDQRAQLVEALRRLEESRPDRVGLAGDLISTTIGAASGVAASGTIAAAAGATTILGSSTLGGALGGVFVASTPIGWVIGAGLAGGALAYGATRLIRNGEAADQTRLSVYQRLKRKLHWGPEPHDSVAEEVTVEQYEIRDKDAYYDFIGCLMQAVKSERLDPERAERLMAAVTDGTMPVEEALDSITPSGEVATKDTTKSDGAWQWLSLDAYRDLLKKAVNSDTDPHLDRLDDYLCENVPSIWLLGKTGAGKSSLVAEITGQDDVAIGNGFEPCTGNLLRYQFPQAQPIMAFLDTRGLGEAGYVADLDIQEASSQAHAIVVVAKIDDPDQSAVMDTLSKLEKASRERVLLVFTAAHGLQDEEEMARAVKYLHQGFTKALKFEFPLVVVDFPTGNNVDQLREKLAQLMPSAELFLRSVAASTHEEKVFLNQRERVLWHAGAAASADLVPGVGLVAVPSIQVKMLYQLSEAYDLDWGRQEVLEFIGSLGASFSVAYGTRVVLTQLGRLVPVWGQTVGQATAMMLSFGTTYALGRGACYYMYQKRHGQEVDQAALKALYEQALKRENLGLQRVDAA